MVQLRNSAIYRYHICTRTETVDSEQYRTYRTVREPDADRIASTALLLQHIRIFSTVTDSYSKPKNMF